MADASAVHMLADERRIVEAILARHVPGATVWVYGSRATGRRVKPSSDLDLALEGAEPIPTSTMIDLADAFDESDLPWKVDLIDWATTSEHFREIIVPDRVLLVPAQGTAA